MGTERVLLARSPYKVNVRPNSEVTITLSRFGGFWGGPAYTVMVGTDGIVFDGEAYVVASGKHTDTTNADELRKLARRFVAAKFYSLNDEYIARVLQIRPLRKSRSR